MAEFGEDDGFQSSKAVVAAPPAAGEEQ